MNSYYAYGLTCISDCAIPGLYPKNSKKIDTDVSITIGAQVPSWIISTKRLKTSLRYHKAARPEAGDCEVSVVVYGSEEFFELTYSGEAQFVLDIQGKRLWATSIPPQTFDDLMIYLRGPVMGFILRQRGSTALHASSISLDGQAIALCGQSQSGKSTTAAALALRGVPVLCEDITALNEESGEFRVQPGYPRVCLWPDAVQHLMGKADALPRLTPNWEKFYLPLNGDRGTFEVTPQKLGVIYLLAPRNNEVDSPRLEQVTPREALLELVQNTYMNWLLTPAQRAAEFDVLSRLVINVPVRRLIPHSSPERIGQLCELILSDARKTVGEQSAGVRES